MLSNASEMGDNVLKAYLSIQWSLIILKLLLTCLFNVSVDDATKRRQVEDLLRGEIENWDRSRPSSSTKS